MSKIKIAHQQNSISNHPLLKMCTEPYWHLEWMLFLAEGFSEKRGCAKPIIELGPLSTGNLGIGSMKGSEVKRKSVENPLTENGDVRL